jgi:hypothetical protein
LEKLTFAQPGARVTADASPPQSAQLLPCRPTLDLLQHTPARALPPATLPLPRPKKTRYASEWRWESVTAESKPYLQAALLCEHALREKDDVLSVIRIVDRWTFKTSKRDAGGQPPPFAVQCTGVVILKSGGFKGKKTISMHLNSPSGERNLLVGVPATFEGQDHGVSVVISLTMRVPEEGLYWIDVLLDDEQVTRMPMRIAYEYVASGSSTT